MKKLIKIIFDKDKIPLFGIEIADRRFKQNQKINRNIFLQNVNEETKHLTSN